METSKSLKESKEEKAASCRSFHLAHLGANYTWNGIYKVRFLSVVNGISFHRFIRHYSYSFTAGLMIPGQVGDAAISVFLKKEGVPLTQGGLAYLIDKAFSLLIFFLVASLGVSIFFPQINPAWFGLIPAISGFVLLATYFPDFDSFRLAASRKYSKEWR